MKGTIIILLIATLIVISGCSQQQTKYVCPDGTTVSDVSLCPKQEDTQKKYCDIINKPAVQLRCRTKSGNTYEYCTVYITPDSRDEQAVSYLLYESVSGTSKREQVSGHQVPFDVMERLKPGDTIEEDKYNYYFEKLISDETSNMFIVIPYDFVNEQHCENLKINLFFSDATIG